MNYIKTNLNYLRIKKGLSHEQMAKALGLAGKSAYFAYEKGVASPKIEGLLKLSDFFEVSVDSLIKKDLSAGQVGWEEELRRRIEKLEIKTKNIKP